MRIEVLVDPGISPAATEEALERAATLAAASRGFHRGEIAIRVAGDATIHAINREHLNHDYPTDVISFGYHSERPQVEGEMIVSADTARRRADEIGWTPANELLLYVIHGVLHLTGMDDKQAADRADMRRAEKLIMMQMGIDRIDHFAVDLAPRPVSEESA